MVLGLFGCLSFMRLMVGSLNVLFDRLLEEDRIFMLLLVLRKKDDYLFLEMIEDFLDGAMLKKGLHANSFSQSLVKNVCMPSIWVFSIKRWHLDFLELTLVGIPFL